jgi:hypothetical protein
MVASFQPVAGGPPVTFPLFDDGMHGDGAAGDGVFGGSVALSASGDFELSITATGTSPQGNYQRQRTTRFSVGVPESTLSGGFQETATAGASGFYDALGWSFVINVPSIGSYAVTGDLAAADATIVGTASSPVTAAAGGPQAVALSFPGQAIYRAAKSGPYTLEHLRITVQTPTGERISGRPTNTAISAGPYWSWLSFQRDHVPAFGWKMPAGQVATTAAAVQLSWLVADGNGGGTIALYYDTTGSGFAGSPITTSLPATSGVSSYRWDMSALPNRVYYVYARIANGDFEDSVYGGSIYKVTDSDGDGFPDEWETAHGLDPSQPMDAYLDPDGDSLANVEEYRHGTDPHNLDSDGGGEPDGSEVDNGRDPRSPGDDVGRISLTLVAPASGDSRGGDQVLILGSGFRQRATVTFGGVPAAAVTVASPSRLFATTPAGGVGRVDVTAADPDGTSATRPGAFSFLCQFVEPPAAASNGPLCPGQDLQLSATGPAGATYSWTGPNGFTSALQNPTIPIVTAAASGTYSVTLRTGSCSFEATTTVVVATPAGPAAASNGPLCAGQDAQLSAATVAGASYLWIGPEGFASTSQNPLISAAQPVQGGVYSVTATVNGCTSLPATTNLTVRPLPTATVSGSQQSCAGRQQSIQAALTGTAPWTLGWSDGAVQQGVAISPAVRMVAPTTSTSYSLASVSDVYCRGTSSGSAAIAITGSCGSSFHTLVPCRLVDTRNADGTYGGPPLRGAQARSFPFAGRCGIPDTAKSVSFNVSVTGASAAGFLTLYPADGPRPPASTINFVAGATRANNAVVGLGFPDGLSVWTGMPAGATVHLILDVNGYFE